MGSDSTWTVSRVDDEAYAAALAAADVDPPIEQSLAWHAVVEADPQRRDLGRYLISSGGRPRAAATVTRLVTHRVPFLWVRHGPVWFTTPDAHEEAAAVAALCEALHEADPQAIHVRMDVRADVPGAQPPTGMITYDHTVVIDTAVPGASSMSEEDVTQTVLSRFKSRGRRDVRKAVRESGLECADETQRAAEDFSEYHALMSETADRDGFVPWPVSFYQEMVTGLGPRHCRVFAGREDGVLVCWSIVTISGAGAARYYAASATSMMRRRVSDRLVLFECVDLARRGITAYDLMGIGSEISPELNGLNEFKTKFSTEITEVAPAREFVLRPMAYKAFRSARAALEGIRGE